MQLSFFYHEIEKLKRSTTKEIGTMFSCNIVSCNVHHSLRVSMYHTSKCILRRGLSKRIVLRTHVSERKKKSWQYGIKKSIEKQNVGYISVLKIIYLFINLD